jgi:hypothetical protein
MRFTKIKSEQTKPFKDTYGGDVFLDATDEADETFYLSLGGEIADKNGNYYNAIILGDGELIWIDPKRPVYIAKDVEVVAKF